jgi:DNA-binding XRE family transcriptional regulator
VLIAKKASQECNLCHISECAIYAVIILSGINSICLMAKSKKLDSDEWIALISEKLKELRKEMGFTSYETFALDHGLDRKQYWRIENGSNITIKTLVKILNIHNRDLASFFNEINSLKRVSSKKSR